MLTYTHDCISEGLVGIKLGGSKNCCSRVGGFVGVKVARVQANTKSETRKDPTS